MYQSVTNFKHFPTLCINGKPLCPQQSFLFFALFYLLLTHCVSRTKDCTKKEVEGGKDSEIAILAIVY